MEMPEELKTEKILAAIRKGGVKKAGPRNIFAEHMDGTAGFSSDAAARFSSDATASDESTQLTIHPPRRYRKI